MLLSMCFHQLVGKRKYSSYFNEEVILCIIAVQLARMSNQILQEKRERATKNV